MTGDTFEKVKKNLSETAEGVKDAAEDVVDPDTYTEQDDKNRKFSKEHNESGGKEPMNPKDIASHEPTAVQRNEDTNIAEGRTSRNGPRRSP
jgi:hypothetical protein